jgi:hypothetical protein
MADGFVDGISSARQKYQQKMEEQYLRQSAQLEEYEREGKGKRYKVNLTPEPVLSGEQRRIQVNINGKITRLECGIEAIVPESVHNRLREMVIQSDRPVLNQDKGAMETQTTSRYRFNHVSVEMPT